MTLKSVSRRLEDINRFVGQCASWMTLAVVTLTFVVVVLRYVFHVGWVWLQDLSVYTHAVIFLSVAGFTLAQNGHVRVDIFYSRLSDKKKALVEILGVLALLFPVCGLIIYQALPYVHSSWSIWEGAQNVGGLPGVFFLKSFILVYAFLLIIQGLASLLKQTDVLLTAGSSDDH